MTAQQHFWNLVYAWSLGLGFVLIALLIIVISLGVSGGSIELHNPLAPAVRMLERRQQHRHELALVRQRAELAARGADPGYIEYLECKAREQPRG